MGGIGGSRMGVGTLAGWDPAGCGAPPGWDPGGLGSGRGIRLGGAGHPAGLRSWSVMALPDATLRRPPLDAAALSARLVRPGGLWREIRVTGETGSTNADLLQEARAGAAEGLVLVAETQTAGRGRLGRSWSSPPRAALACSVLLRPAAVPPAARGWLPLLTGIAVAAALRAEAGVPAGLKWPNDVLVADRKIAGILAEAHDDAIVVGIGLNVTLTAAELPAPSATSLLLEGAACLDRERLLAATLTGLADRYRTWAAGPGAAGPAQPARRSRTARGVPALVCHDRPGDPGGAAHRAAARRHGGRRGRDGPASRADRLRHHPGRRRRRRARPLTSGRPRRCLACHVTPGPSAETLFRATMCAMSMESQLSDGERSVLTLHPHWKTLLRPVLLLVVVIVAAVALLVVIPPGRLATPGRIAVGVVAVVLAVAVFAVPFLRWQTTTYRLTTRRLQLRSGILTRSGRDFPLIRISDVSFSQGPIDRLIGSGRLVVESAGEHGQLVLREIPDVQEVQATLFQLVGDEHQRLAREEN